MDRHVDRRQFLKTIPTVSGALASVSPWSRRTASAQPVQVRISSVPYRPIDDYPIKPKRFSEVRLTDGFWKPKVATNAAVTIPFEVQKLSEIGREFRGNVLEAAIMSLRTHPNPTLQAQVDGAIQAIVARPGDGNGGFEVAATYLEMTGKRDLLDLAI